MSISSVGGPPTFRVPTARKPSEATLARWNSVCASSGVRVTTLQWTPSVDRHKVVARPWCSPERGKDTIRYVPSRTRSPDGRKGSVPSTETMAGSAGTDQCRPSGELHRVSSTMV